MIDIAKMKLDLTDPEQEKRVRAQEEERGRILREVHERQRDLAHRITEEAVRVARASALR